MDILAFYETAVFSPAMVQQFFDEREDQSEVKARIVSKYFGVWAKIIAPKARAKRIGYIDLFAGPGRYKDGSASTPLMVLQQAIADPELRTSLVTYFNDEQPEHTKSLANEINALPNIATLKYSPQITTGNVGAEKRVRNIRVENGCVVCVLDKEPQVDNAFEG